MGDGDASCRAPLDSCLRRNDARGGVRACGGSWWLRALRQAQGERNCEARLRRGGGRGCGAGWWWGALRQAQGERTRGVGVRRGVGDAMGEGDAPRRAPALDSRFRGNDDVGGRVGGGCWWRRGESPAAAGRALREAPLRRGVGESGMRRGLVVGALRQAQGERISWSAPTAGWGSRGCDGGWWGGPFDRLRANGIAVCACDGVGVGNATGGEGGVVAGPTLRGGGSSGR